MECDVECDVLRDVYEVADVSADEFCDSSGKVIILRGWCINGDNTGIFIILIKNCDTTNT